MISLQSFNKMDFDQLIEWMPDEETLMQFAGPSFNFPLTAEQLKISVSDTQRRTYKVVHTPDQVTIGHAEICLYDAVTAFLCRIVIGNLLYRGKGFGTDIVHTLCLLAFDEPGIQKIMLNVFDWNMPAIACYKKAGFSFITGKTITRHINNKSWTVLQMQLDKRKQ